jgi:hypothetical protein
MEGMVQYKFKSAKDFDSVSFSGTVIRLFDLKRAIVEAKALHKGMDFDLSVINDQTKEGGLDFPDESASAAVLYELQATKCTYLLATSFDVCVGYPVAAG